MAQEIIKMAQEIIKTTVCTTEDYIAIKTHLKRETDKLVDLFANFLSPNNLSFYRSSLSCSISPILREIITRNPHLATQKNYDDEDCLLARKTMLRLNKNIKPRKINIYPGYEQAY